MPAIEVDEYVVDTLMADLVGHDRQPSAFLVYLFLWRRTHGAGEETGSGEPVRPRDRHGTLEARGAGGAAMAQQAAPAVDSARGDHGDSGVYGPAAVGSLIVRLTWRSWRRRRARQLQDLTRISTAITRISRICSQGIEPPTTVSDLVLVLNSLGTQ